MSLPHFEYQPIDQSVAQIRVLTLHPGSSGDPISCSLTHHRLQHDNDYEALSYCWGDPTPNHLISIDTASLRVTKSAHDALRHLRFKDRDRRLWIDAICINQKDKTERNHQVHHMGQIFKGASRVLAWLGPASSGTDKAFDLIRAVTGKLPMKPAIEVWHAVKALQSLMERPFWGRTWILQEIICPTRPPLIGCGTQWEEWETWASASAVAMGTELEDILNPKSSLLGHQTTQAYARAFEMFSGINYLRDLSYELRHNHSGRGGITNLNEILTVSINTKCSDIRDHVFAIVGMIHFDGASAAVMCPPKPDYNKPVGKVFMEMAKFSIESDRTLIILFLRTHLRTGVDSLPSWAPDFSCNSEAIRYPALSRVTRSVPTQSEHLPVVSDSGVLQVHGKIIGKIHRTYGLEHWWTGLDKVIRFVGPLNEPYLDQLYGCLTGGQDSGGESFDWFKEAFNRASLSHDGYYWDPNPESDRPGEANKDEIIEAITRSIALLGGRGTPHRKLYMASVDARFRLGLGSPDCEEGDIVCLVAGGHAPLILRPVDNDQYEYIGDSFVPGHMEEDMERALQEDIGIKWTRFDIR
ncbi:heterokaryon incompatibility protein-domain-containing protein [Cercophora samala]|uniref:Heterokaryon incompatibility protein-domain-containing protein n=1 Tax=Cercophora samala TaxID=330535 RepID=A0AA40DDC2_9PEZI|nr:heterokaryon incompatibility protein-domain-containing protein [Cercophora samala]